jgi:hypothetical protein
VPAAENIHSWATAAANDWRWLAVLWHVALGASLIVVVTGLRPSARLVGWALVPPVASVSVVAWLSGNPFNGLTFAVLAVLLLHAATRIPHAAATRASLRWVLAGAALVAVGWTYPHFLRTDTWTAYAYASPFGLLPCPTLSVVIGITLILSGLQSTGWSVLLIAAGVLYGVIGVFSLRVSLDIWLLAGAILLGMRVASDVTPGRVRAKDHERTRRLPATNVFPRRSEH